jgi:hypothetical protein
VGYDIHITRCRFSPFSEQYPITIREWLALAERRSDIVFDTEDPAAPPHMDADGTDWLWLYVIAPGHPDEPRWLHCHWGHANTKNPEEWFIAHMLTIAADLDAWVVGDYGEAYGLTDGVLTQRPDDPAAFIHPPISLERDYALPLGLTRDGWIATAAAWPDFEIRTEIEATVPSGKKVIPSPPTAYWTGHSSGVAIPYYFQFDSLYVGAKDEETVRRAIEVGDTFGMRLEID